MIGSAARVSRLSGAADVRQTAAGVVESTI
jgi:hypothetical protein